MKYEKHRSCSASFFFEEVNGGVDPYKVAPPCRYDHRALVAYAEKVGKSINDLSIEEKSQFIEGLFTEMIAAGGFQTISLS